MTTRAHKVRCVKEWIILTHYGDDESSRKYAIEDAKSGILKNQEYRTVWDVVCSTEVDLDDPKEDRCQSDT